jgi:hypothetical protein
MAASGPCLNSALAEGTSIHAYLTLRLHPNTKKKRDQLQAEQKVPKCANPYVS